MTEATAAEAMARANEAHLKIESHEDLCAERYANIHTALGGVEKTVDRVLSVLAWGGSGLVALLLVVLGFFMTRAISNNDQQVAAMRAQITLLTAPQHAPNRP